MADTTARTRDSSRPAPGDLALRFLPPAVDRRIASRNDAKRRDDADASPMRDRLPAVRIENVAVAASVDVEIALVVAARRNGAVVYGKQRDCAIGRSLRRAKSDARTGGRQWLRLR